MIRSETYPCARTSVAALNASSSEAARSMFRTILFVFWFWICVVLYSYPLSYSLSQCPWSWIVVVVDDVEFGDIYNLSKNYTR